MMRTSAPPRAVRPASIKRSRKGKRLKTRTRLEPVPPILGSRKRRDLHVVSTLNNEDGGCDGGAKRGWNWLAKEKADNALDIVRVNSGSI